MCGPEEDDGVRPKSAPVALWSVVHGTAGVAEGGFVFFEIRGIVDEWGVVWLQMAARGLDLVTVAGTGASFERG